VKVFFDTNVYVAEALLGQVAEQLLEVTERAGWRIQSSSYVLDEVERVMVERLRFSRRLAGLTRQRIRRRTRIIDAAATRHEVPADPKDSAILQSALAGGADYLVTNDSHLLRLHPYQGLRIVSMTEYYRLLVEHGHLTPEQERD
jgi:putative PIN family toxin of toxin-antitoxin system